MTTPLHAADIHTLAMMIRAGETTSGAILESCLEQIATHNATSNAYNTVTADRARAQARAADRELSAGHPRSPLHGIPISIKDLIDVEGVATTAASAVRGHALAERDATVVTRLREAGAIIVGKCNLHEFAFGTTNEDSAFGPSRHPLDPTRSPGGSSGGSAASVVHGMAIASIGTDTGGSVRIPAAACGLVGLKPTYGEVVCDGVVPLSRSLDHVGPLCRTVADAWLLYEILSGHTPSHDIGPSALRGPSISTLRVGVPRPYFLDRLDPDVRAGFERALRRIEGAGAAVADVAIRHADDTAPVYLLVSFPEAAAYHARTLDTRPTDYTPPVRLRLEAARHVLAEDHVRARRGRDQLTADVDEALDHRDILVLPTLAIPAPPLGAASVQVGDRPESVRTITLRLTQLFNLTGHPALTLPIEPTPNGLPVGLQIVGRRGETRALIQAAASVEALLATGRRASVT
jgi:aspartyl-tRNA(Asn)/glutamyl-tRNA(Gln) amidotransferase subunit A